VARRSWNDANQAYLVQALARLKGALRRRAAGAANAPVADMREAGPGREDQAILARRPPALEILADAFGLSAFERDVLLLCAGIDLDPEFAPLCAEAHRNGACAHVSFALAFATLADPHWSALSPNGPLRRWRLVEVAAAVPLMTAALRIDERVLHYLAGISHLDQRLDGMVTTLPLDLGDDLVPSHAAVTERIAAAWSREPSSAAAAVMQVCGDPADCRPIAAAVAKALGLRAAVVAADLVPRGPHELEAFLRLWEREASLSGIGVVLIEAVEGDVSHPPDHGRVPQGAGAHLCERLAGFVMMCERQRRPIMHRPSVAIDVHHPLAHEQRQAWSAALRLDAEALGIAAVSAHFDLGLGAIRAIAGEVLAASAEASSGEVAVLVWKCCRAHLRARLDGLAERINCATSWDDLVLPEAQTRTLRAIAAQLRQRTTVYDRWGFGHRNTRGLGISALFAGPSGTGKTLAAEVLANELELDLYRIDLSSVVSKYIGETEKNLRRLFDAAEESGAILLFDEADALFGRRSEVKDSHDRYANIEVSYLLQRMEAYRGLAILTTNARSALDPAFLRRLRFVVEFPFPDVDQRAEIWRRIFPGATPTERLNVAKLASLRIPGGNIRNIAMNAAFLAADAGEPVRMGHLLAAARSEYAKIDRPLTAAEADGWV
jgi:hypothetical protein